GCACPATSKSRRGAGVIINVFACIVPHPLPGWQPAAARFAALPWGKAAKNVAFFKFCIHKQGSPLYNAIGLQFRQPNTLIKSGGENGPMKPRQATFRQGANSGGERKMKNGSAQ